MEIILFDVGNVIVKADHAITHSILQKYGVPEDRAKTFFQNEDYKEFGRGNIDSKTFYRALINEYLKFPLDYARVKYAHNEHLYGVDNGIVRILSKLPCENLAFLTNTNEWQTEREQRLIDLRKFSKRIFRSHEIHMLKSDNGCFQYVISQLSATPSEIILVDDSLENVLVAEKNGLQTLHFRSSRQLKSLLVKRGFL